MGGPRRTPKESVDALEEAITLIRAFFGGETLRQEGEFYSAAGGKPGRCRRTRSGSGSAPTARGCCG